MKASITLPNPMPQTQHGAVLITGLLILLVLTILGVTGMSGSSLQERMSGNDRERQVAFQAAEAALRGGENFIGNPAASFNSSDFSNTCVGGLCNPFTPSDITGDKPDTEQWLIAGNWNDASKHKKQAMTGDLVGDPKYIIEYLGKQVIAPETTITCSTTPANCNDIYRITAIGTGRTPTSRVMLQSIFIRVP